MDVLDEIMDEVTKNVEGAEPEAVTKELSPEEREVARNTLFEKLEKGEGITKGDVEQARIYKIEDAARETWIEQHGSEPTRAQLEEFVDKTMPEKTIPEELVEEVKEAFQAQFDREPNNEELAESVQIQIENDNKDPGEWNKEVEDAITKELEVFNSREIFDIAEMERKSAEEAYKDLNQGSEPTQEQIDEFVKELGVPDMPETTEVKELTVAGAELEEFIQEYMAENDGKEPTPQELEDHLNKQGPKFALGGEKEEVIVEPTEEEKAEGAEPYKEVFGKIPEEKEVDEYLAEFGIGADAGREATEEMKQGELQEREPTAEENEIVEQEIKNELLKQLDPDMTEADEVIKELMSPLIGEGSSEDIDKMTYEEQADYLNREFLDRLVGSEEVKEEAQHQMPPQLAHLNKDDIKWYIKDFIKQNGRKPDKYELTDYMVAQELEAKEYFGLTPSSRDLPGFITDAPDYPGNENRQLTTGSDDGIFNSMNVGILAGVLALLGVISYMRRNSSAS